MSLSVFEPSRAKASNAAIHANAAISLIGNRKASRPTTSRALAPYVDQPHFEYTSETTSASNPLADLIPDELYSLLRSNDMINEKAVRDYIIRRAFRELREQHNLKTTEAIEKLKEIYPYLQLDTIRKIIYRITPVGRKMMI